MKIEEKINKYLNEAQRFYTATKRKWHTDWVIGQGVTKKEAKRLAALSLGGVHKADIVELGVVKAQDTSDAREKAKNGEWIEKIK